LRPFLYFFFIVTNFIFFSNEMKIKKGGFYLILVVVAVGVAGISVSAAAEVFDVGRFYIGVGGHQQLGLGRGRVHKVVLVRFDAVLVSRRSVIIVSGSVRPRCVFIVVVNVLVLQLRFFRVGQLHDAAEAGAVVAKTARRGLGHAAKTCRVAEVVRAEVGRERFSQGGKVALLAAGAAEAASAAETTGWLGKSSGVRGLWKVIVTAKQIEKNYMILWFFFNFFNTFQLLFVRCSIL
jgi:hypothetical protein